MATAKESVVKNAEALKEEHMLNNKGFDAWAKDYDEDVRLSDIEGSYPFAAYNEIQQYIYERVTGKGSAKVLDIGFGTGKLTTRLYADGCDIYGQDFSEEMCKTAHEKMPNAKLFCGDFSLGLVPPLCDERFDFIIATYSLHHLTDDEKVGFISALKDRLLDGGKILIGDVAFVTRAELEKCSEIAGDEWDDDEIYFVASELKAHFPTLEFIRFSPCSGVIVI